MKYLLRTSSSLDPDLVHAAIELVKPCNRVWDVGANVGLFARAAAFRAGADGQVLCLEPDIDVVQLLMRTVRTRRQTDAPMTVLPLAVGSASSILRLHVASRSRASNFLESHGTSQAGRTGEIRAVPCTTLDVLFEQFGPPDVIKIDVEGAELDVLSGGVRVIENKRPIFCIEVSRKNNGEVSEFFERHNYGLWNCHGFRGTENSLRVSDCVHNTIAVPAEKVSSREIKCT